jgi:Ca-activated chloride channel family protein
MDTTTGMLTVLSLGLAQDEIWAGGLSDDSAITIDSDLGVLRFRRVVADVADDVGTQLRRYVEASEPMEVMSALPLTERQLWRFNRGDLPLPPADQSTDSDAPAVAMDGPPPTPLQAVYPTEGTVAADYPFVTLRGPWLDGSAATAAAEFAEFLTSDAGRSVLLEQGFRGPQNRPNPNFELGQGLTPSLGGDYAPVPDAETTRSVRQSWRNVTRPSSTLMLVDVSGSMLQDIGDGETTRLDATVEAAVRSLDVLPVTSDVGLWEFSTGLEDGRNEGDYRELVDVGPLDGRVDDQRRKTAVVDALRGLEPQNDTALNDTLLAAYTTMRDEYDPDRRSTIVLLTDGRNDDDGSLTHEQLLDQLSAERDDERRVRLVAIAYGDGADIANLEEVTEVTGGKVLASPNADDLDELFLEALSGS